MKNRTSSFAFLLAAPLLVALAPRSAEANSQIATAHVARPLTLPKSTLRVDGGPRWAPFGPDGQISWTITPGDNILFVNPGVTFGIVDDLELGGVLPIRVAPDTELSEFRFHGIYRFLRGEHDVGVFWQASAALQSDLYDAWLLAGVPAQIRLAKTVRLDTGGFLQAVFADDTNLNLYLQAALPIQLGTRVFVGPETRLSAYLDGDAADLMLGGFFGYTLVGNRGTLGDLSIRGRLLDVGDGDVVQVILAADLYFDL